MTLTDAPHEGRVSSPRQSHLAPGVNILPKKGFLIASKPLFFTIIKCLPLPRSQVEIVWF